MTWGVAIFSCLWSAEFFMASCITLKTFDWQLSEIKLIKLQYYFAVINFVPNGLFTNVVLILLILI